MNTTATAATVPAIKVSASTDRFRTFAWLIRRELWEHRSRFIITPIVVSAMIILAIIFGLFQSNGHVSMDGQGIHLDAPGVSGNAVVLKGAHFMFSFASYMMYLLVLFFVTVYYTLDTLCTDRRDRSIFFWKSLPVSDFETVASKLAIAAFVAPAITLVIVLATQYIELLLLTIGLLAHGQSASILWKDIPFIQNILLLIYTMIGIGLWYLPVWAWCLFVSSWAQRAAFLWASIPIGALCFLEYLTLGTHHVPQYLLTRAAGMFQVMFHVDQDFGENFKNGALTSLNLSDIVTPGHYFSSPQLWIGLLLTAGLVTATIWMRKFRETT